MELGEKSGKLEWDDKDGNRRDGKGGRGRKDDWDRFEDEARLSASKDQGRRSERRRGKGGKGDDDEENLIMIVATAFITMCLTSIVFITVLCCLKRKRRNTRSDP